MLVVAIDDVTQVEKKRGVDCAGSCLVVSCHVIGHGLRRAVKPSFIARCALSDIANRSYDFGGAISSQERKNDRYSQQHLSDANGVRLPRSAAVSPRQPRLLLLIPASPKEKCEIGSSALAT